MRRKVCVVSGARSDYGLLYWTMRAIAQHPGLQLQIIATGMHLSPEFGLTYKQIEGDGFKIDARVEMLLSSDSSSGVVKSVGLGVTGFADAFERLGPDIVLLLGDRFEMLAAAQSAMLMGLPLAHVHGGEVTEGAYDEFIRHALTKMSHWHFVTAEPHRKRVVQMGEDPARVFDVGAPGLDHLNRIKLMSRQELEQDLQISLAPPIFLITYHPATLSDRSPEQQLNELLIALDSFPVAAKIFTYPNADTGGRAIIDRINEYVATHYTNACAFVSLGQKRYFSLMTIADVVIGNSSSGIIEAPALQKATVNIGERQKNRLRVDSIIDVSEDHRDIVQGIDLALSDEFRNKTVQTVSRYGKGDTGIEIANILGGIEISPQKTFFDIKHSY